MAWWINFFTCTLLAHMGFAAILTLQHSDNPVITLPRDDQSFMNSPWCRRGGTYLLALAPVRSLPYLFPSYLLTLSNTWWHFTVLKYRMFNVRVQEEDSFYLPGERGIKIHRDALILAMQCSKLHWQKKPINVTSLCMCCTFPVVCMLTEDS